MIPVLTCYHHFISVLICFAWGARSKSIKFNSIQFHKSHFYKSNSKFYTNYIQYSSIFYPPLSSSGLFLCQVPSESSADFWRLQAERRERAAAKQMEILTDSTWVVRGSKGIQGGLHGITIITYYNIA